MFKLFKKLWYKIFGGGKPKVTASPSHRLPEWYGYLNEAQRILKMKLKADSHGRFIPAEAMVDNKAAIRGRAGVGAEWVGGDTGGSLKKGLTSRLAVYPAGNLGPLTGLHEAAHTVLFSNGNPDGEDHHRIMREKGIK